MLLLLLLLDWGGVVIADEDDNMSWPIVDDDDCMDCGVGRIEVSGADAVEDDDDDDDEQEEDGESLNKFDRAWCWYIWWPLELLLWCLYCCCCWFNKLGELEFEFVEQILKFKNNGIKSS